MKTATGEVKTNLYVGKNVKKYMDERGLKQYELAKLAGVGKATISELIAGKKMPTVSLLEKLAKVLGCSLADLFKND